MVTERRYKLLDFGFCLGYAEIQASRSKAMTMADWIEKFNFKNERVFKINMLNPVSIVSTISILRVVYYLYYFFLTKFYYKKYVDFIKGSKECLWRSLRKRVGAIPQRFKSSTLRLRLLGYSGHSPLNSENEKITSANRSEA